MQADGIDDGKDSNVVNTIITRGAGSKINDKMLPTKKFSADNAFIEQIQNVNRAEELIMDDIIDHVETKNGDDLPV